MPTQKPIQKAPLRTHVATACKEHPKKVTFAVVLAVIVEYREPIIAFFKGLF